MHSSKACPATSQLQQCVRLMMRAFEAQRRGPGISFILKGPIVSYILRGPAISYILRDSTTSYILRGPTTSYILRGLLFPTF